MRLVMLGTGPFAVPAFRRLYDTAHQVAALVTGPLRLRAGAATSGEAAAPPGAAIRAVAAQHGTPLFDPEDVNAPDARERLAAFAADLLVVCDYGQILKAETLAAARLGGINLHGSLLPKYRGAAPINWAIWRGETETGVSVIHMSPRVDAGPVIAQAPTAIGPDETAAELEPRLAELGAGLVVEAIDALAQGPVEAIPQDPALASRAPRLKKTDGLIDWNRPAQEIKNQVRALEPWPKGYTFWLRAGKPPLRLILGPVEVVPREQTAAPGTVLEAQKDRLVVAAGRDALSLSALQPAGKRLFSVREFLNGFRVRPGNCFGAG